MKLRVRPIAAASALAFICAGCATGSTVESDMSTPEPQYAPVTFEIENSIEPAQGVATMLSWDEPHDDEALGAIPAMGAESFTWIPEAPRSDVYRLVATDRDGRQHVSPDFSLLDVTLVTWDIGENEIVVVD
jgi:hypothetical protein